jgi:hypothetical protein
VKHLATLALAALALAGCEQLDPNYGRAIETHRTEEGRTSELLMEVDGCRVWRLDGPDFPSGGVYVARCPEGAARTDWTRTRRTGKVSTTYHVGVTPAN